MNARCGGREGAAQTQWKEEQLSFSWRNISQATQNQARLLSLSSLIIVTQMPS